MENIDQLMGVLFIIDKNIEPAHLEQQSDEEIGQKVGNYHSPSKTNERRILFLFGKPPYRCPV